MLLTATGAGTTAIMREAGVSKTAVWRLQERFMADGVDGLLRDRTRPPGRAPLTSERVAEVVRLTRTEPPHEATHWTARANGQGLRPRRLDGAGDLEGARSGAASLARLQAFDRSRLRRQAA